MEWQLRICAKGKRQGLLSCILDKVTEKVGPKWHLS